MKGQTKYIIYHQSLWQSFLSDAVTFGCFVICSMSCSGFWTGVLLFMFFAWIASRAPIFKNKNELCGTLELREYVNKEERN